MSAPEKRLLRGWYWPFVGPFWLLWQLVKNPGAWVTLLALFGLLQLGGFDFIKGYWTRMQEARQARDRLAQAQRDIERLQGEYRTLADATRLDEAFELTVTRTGLFTWRVQAVDREQRPITASEAGEDGFTIDVEDGLYRWVRRTLQGISERAKEDVSLSEDGEDTYVVSSLQDLEQGRIQLALKTRLVSFEAPAGWPDAGSRKVDLGTWEFEIRGVDQMAPVVVGGSWMSPRNEQLWNQIKAEANPDQSALFSPEVDLGSMPRGSRYRYTFRMNEQGAVSPGWVLKAKERLPAGE